MTRERMPTTSSDITCVTHVADCDDCGGIYQCALCGELFGWCYGAHDEFFDLCDGCATTCAYCGCGLRESNYATHRDGMGIGPVVPLCEECGGAERPTCQQIWNRIAWPQSGAAE